MAEAYTYPGVTSGDALTDEYIDEARIQMKTAISKGGRRLAEVIKQIYPNSSSITTE